MATTVDSATPPAAAAAASTPSPSFPDAYSLASLNLPTVPGSNPTRQALDSFKLAVAKLAAETWGEDVGKVFEAVDTQKKGADLCLPVPRFKKGKPDPWAQQVLDRFKPDNALASARHEGPFLLFDVK